MRSEMGLAATAASVVILQVPFAAMKTRRPGRKFGGDETGSGTGRGDVSAAQVKDDKPGATGSFFYAGAPADVSISPARTAVPRATPGRHMRLWPSASAV